MAVRSALVDTGFLVALFQRRDEHHQWAAALAAEVPPRWLTCEAVLSETEHLLDRAGVVGLKQACRNHAIELAFDLVTNLDSVLDLMDKYADVPMSLADACLVRITEILPEPLLLTTDSDFGVYRRFGRRVIPCRLP